LMHYFVHYRWCGSGGTTWCGGQMNGLTFNDGAARFLATHNRASVKIILFNDDDDIARHAATKARNN